MISDASQELLTWLSSVCPDIAAEIAPPGAVAEDGLPRLRLHLLDLSPHTGQLRRAESRGTVLATFMITVADSDPLAAQETLTLIAAASMDGGPAPLSLRPTAPQTWLAFGVQPQPALYFDMPVLLPRQVEPSPIVTEAPEIRMRPLLSLSGRVTGPGGKGLAGARVSQTDGLGTSVRTDAHGIFTLDGVPSGGPIGLTIRSGSSAMTTSVTHSDDPVVIAFQPQEV